MQVKQKYSLPFIKKITRPLVAGVVGSLFRILAPVKVSGVENIPQGEPYIVAANHVSIFDPPFVICFWPKWLEVVGTSDLWQRKGQNVVIGLYHVIPVHRGDYDRGLFETVNAILASGRPLLIAPEGARTRKPGMMHAKPGVAFMLELANVPVLPVGVVGTTDDFFKRAIRGERPQLEMRIGKPLRLPPLTEKGEARRAARQRNTDWLMNHIAGLLPEEYRGVYASTAITQS